LFRINHSFSLQTRTYIHLFDECTQNGFGVVSIIENTLATLKALKPDKTETSHRRYKYVNETLQHFWKKWQREYFTNLRESHDCNTQATGKTPKVGDVVTVFEEGVKKNGWKMAVVESLIVGKDKLVRGANVRVITKGRAIHLSRPVQKLFPVEIRTETSEISEDSCDGKPAERLNS